MILRMERGEHTISSGSKEIEQTARSCTLSVPTDAQRLIIEEAPLHSYC